MEYILYIIGGLILLAALWGVIKRLLKILWSIISLVIGAGIIIFALTACTNF
ncbi:hypothetical protein [Mycoplasmopsis gallinacea]|uniref:Uncharacterized protein n=1 Tax=Mycoplasmopsis gallinacea TaxID=29556 RepID=A0A6H0V583_9BACT|nr:hypothetical protein [Mycoplasmopsis gallinacea]QIW62187.1 hypothetical protein GOQ20_01885 [Mycoplasmopsis gallinacea]